MVCFSNLNFCYSFCQEDGRKILEMSTKEDEDSVMAVKLEACEVLLQHRVEQKFRTKKVPKSWTIWRMNFLILKNGSYYFSYWNWNLMLTNWFARKNVDDTVIFVLDLLLSRNTFVRLLARMIVSNLEVYFVSAPSWAHNIFHSFLIFVLFSSTLRSWDKSAAIQELFCFLGIGTKQFRYSGACMMCKSLAWI